jgi:5-methylcytosine-specific restriction endonuclease McrA
MKLSHLTDKNLLIEMISLVQRERALLAQVLWHLKEIDRRKLYSDQKCGSLFEYCVKVLKYSEGQASRRVSACRLLKELPELADTIQKGELNLTQLNQAKGFFHEMGIVTPDEKKKIINEIKGKTIRETEVILENKKGDKPSRKVTVALNQETLETLKKLQALKAHSCPDLDSVIMKMAEVASEAWDPTINYRRRKLGEGKSRYVQVGVRAEVWERDCGKCTQCGSIYALEIDHIKPYAQGGKTLPENLRLLCRNCNQRKGAIAFPKGFKPQTSRS